MIQNPSPQERARQDLPLLVTLEDAQLLTYAAARILLDTPNARPHRPDYTVPSGLDPTLFVDCLRIRDRIAALIVARDEAAAELAERDARAERQVRP